MTFFPFNSPEPLPVLWQSVPTLPSADSNQKAPCTKPWPPTLCALSSSRALLKKKRNNVRLMWPDTPPLLRYKGCTGCFQKWVVKYVKPFGTAGRKPELKNHLGKSNGRASHLSPTYAGTFPSLLLRYQPGPKHSFTTAKALLNSTTFIWCFLYTSAEDKMRLSEATGLWRALESFCHSSTIPLDI